MAKSAKDLLDEVPDAPVLPEGAVLLNVPTMDQVTPGQVGTVPAEFADGYEGTTSPDDQISINRMAKLGYVPLVKGAIDADNQQICLNEDRFRPDASKRLFYAGDVVMVRRVESGRLVNAAQHKKAMEALKGTETRRIRPDSASQVPPTLASLVGSRPGE
jgi:hypothetical protein